MMAKGIFPLTANSTNMKRSWAAASNPDYSMPTSSQNPTRGIDDHYNMLKQQDLMTKAIGGGMIANSEMKYKQLVNDENALWSLGQLLEFPPPEGLAEIDRTD
jgi:hypothetical protein